MCAQGGTTSLGLLPYNITCPPGTFITAFDIHMAHLSRSSKDTVGSFTEAVGHRKVLQVGTQNKVLNTDNQASADMIFFGPVACSPDSTGATDTAEVIDRSSPKHRPLGALKSRSELGYTGVDLYTGTRINAVGPMPFSGRVGSSKSDVTYYMLGGEGEYKSVQCPAGQLVSGLYGQATEQGVVTVGLQCRRIAGLDSVKASG